MKAIRWNKNVKVENKIGIYKIISVNIDKVVLECEDDGFKKHLVVEKVRRIFYLQKFMFSQTGKTTTLMISEYDLGISQEIIEQMKYIILEHMYDETDNLTEIAKYIGIEYSRAYRFVNSKRKNRNIF